MNVFRLLLIETGLISFLSLIALFPYIPLYASAFFGLIYLFFLYRSFEGESVAHGKFLNFLAILLSIFFLSQVRLSNLVRPLEYLLLSLNAIKLAGEKKPRDFIQILLLNFLIVAGVASFTIEITYLVMLLLFIAVAINFAVNINLYESFGGDVKSSMFKFSAKMFAVSIPMAILFFYMLPRSGSAYFLGGPGGASRIGFTETIDINNVEKLLKSGKVAFRARILRGNAGHLPYWRGLTYDIYRKGAWFHRKQAVGAIPINYPVWFRRMNLKGDTVVQEINLEPGQHRYLYAIDKPIGGLFPFRAYVSSDLIISGETRGRVKYRVVSINSRVLPESYSRIWSGYTYVPQTLKDTLRKLFSFINGSPEIMAEKLVLYFRSRFKYSLSFEALRGENPVLYFLTMSKSGHCELFATSMALILRSFGVPARLVGGYLGGNYNKLGNYFIVRENDAHTWVEIYIKGVGWKRYDPSPPARFRKKHFNPGLYIDYLRLLWYEHVINYDIYSQFRILSSVSKFAPVVSRRRGRINTGGPVNYRWGLGALILILSVFFAVSMRRKRAMGFYEEALKILEKKGIPKKPGETPAEFLKRVKESRPEVGEVLEEITRVYLEEEFGGKKLEASKAALLSRLKRKV